MELVQIYSALSKLLSENGCSSYAACESQARWDLCGLQLVWSSEVVVFFSNGSEALSYQ